MNDQRTSKTRLLIITYCVNRNLNRYCRYSIQRLVARRHSDSQHRDLADGQLIDLIVCNLFVSSTTQAEKEIYKTLKYRSLKKIMGKLCLDVCFIK